VKRIFLILVLLLLKRILFKGNLTLKIIDGPNKGKRWRFNTNSNNEFIIGSWEKPMHDIYFRYLKQNDVVYDLGAHQGFLAIMASHLVGAQGKVFAFEPLPANFNLLSQHILINGITNCQIYFGAVSEKSGVVNFSVSEADVSNTYVTTSPAFNKHGRHIQSQSFSLDDLILTEKISRPDFIKIDVEGAEYDVLKGAVNLLTFSAPMIYLETHEIHIPGVDSACLNFLNEIGYKVIENLIPETNGKMAAYILSKS
jgi:FkbM family methyltransferase